MDTIIVGSTGSAGSLAAVQWSADLAAALKVPVIAAYVLTPSTQLARDFSPSGLGLWRQEIRHNLFRGWTEPLRQAGVSARYQIVEADSTVKGLSMLAEREDASLIVVGQTGRHRLAGHVLGGVGPALAPHTKRPVVIVPRDCVRLEANRDQRSETTA